MATCGIDLGTTNSLISVFTPDGPKLISNVHGDVLTPSVVGLAEDGTMLVGKAARDRLLTHPDKTVGSFKRYMGAEKALKVGGKDLRPEELSALVLRSLKADAEANLDEEIEEVIVSVPAYFNDHQRKATMDACRLAGLNVERVINEPTAAALAYGLANQSDGKFLVFDLGGGTFDVSILDKYDGVMEVRGTAGDTALGGNDFTQAIARWVADNHDVKTSQLDLVDNARLQRASEKLKVDLTADTEARYDLMLAGRQCSGTFHRDEFEREVTPLLRRLRAPMERSLNDAALNPDELDAVILVGGATRMPMIRSLVARLFGRLPLVHVDPDTTVALGAAVQAGLKSRSEALDDIVMTDVCPFTLGVKVVDRHSPQMMDFRISPIIERNAVVPISRSDLFAPTDPAQSFVKLEVYQGENLRPEHNVKIGELDIKVPYNKEEAELVEVRFTYDINGALEVIATVLSTKKVQTRIFKKEPGLSEEELEKRFLSLQELKLHPRDQAENSALIARAERLYAESRGETRDQIRYLLDDFQLRIADQSARDLDQVREKFAHIMDELETKSLFQD